LEEEMSAASKRTIRRLVPFGVIVTLAALLGVAGASIGGSEFNVYIGSNFLDANSFVIFQTPQGGLVNSVEVGSALQFTIGIANNTNAPQAVYLTANVTLQNGTPVPAGAGPTVKLGCNAPNGCPINAAATAFDFPAIDATGAVPGTYLLSFVATDAATNNQSYSPTYSFVVSSPAAALKGNSLSASTLMTINLSGTQTIYAAPTAAAPSAVDSTTGTASTATSAFARPVTLILNNVGTSTIVVNDDYNTVTLGAGDVIAAQFLSTVRAHVIEGVPGTLRVGLP
jgi:hypothetical protein